MQATASLPAGQSQRLLHMNRIVNTPKNNDFVVGAYGDGTNPPIRSAISWPQVRLRVASPTQERQKKAGS